MVKEHPINTILLIPKNTHLTEVTSRATELKADTVHALTRLTPSAALFRFTATSNYQSGETFTVDNEQVTALLPSGETLGNLAYTIGAEVLCCLVGTRLTVYVPSGVVAKASDSERLNGEEASYYGTAEGVENAQKTADAAGVLATQNQTEITALKERIKTYIINFPITIAGNQRSFTTQSFSIPSDETIIGATLNSNEPAIVPCLIYQVSNTSATIGFINYYGLQLQVTIQLMITTIKNV